MAETPIHGSGPPLGRAVVLAPYHADADERVRRSLRAVARLYSEVNVFWDEAYLGHQFVDASSSQFMGTYGPYSRSGLLPFFLGVGRFTDDVQDALSHAGLVYVHASGMLGVLYAAAARRVAPGAKVVFDYHDSLRFELRHQAAKVGLAWASRLTWWPYARRLRSLGRVIDGLVGISELQVEECRQVLGRRLPSLVVPNVRTFDSSLEPHSEDGDGHVSFVWLGQVMPGRDLEAVAEGVAGLPPGNRLHVYGQVLSPDVQLRVEAVLGDRVRFHGPFRSDADLADRLPPNPVGVFLGWADPGKTGINGIASPNKFFTYMNLRLPVLLGAELTGLTSEVTRAGAGVVVAGPGDFHRAAAALRSRYSEWAQGMATLKGEYLAHDFEIELAEWLGSLIRRDRTDQPEPER